MMYSVFHQMVGQEITGIEIDGKSYSEDEIKKALEITYAHKLEDRMKAAGMFTVDEMMQGMPIDQWMRHTGVKDLDTFGQYLERKTREYLSLKAGLESGTSTLLDEDESYKEWVNAHYAVFRDIHVNFMAMRERAGI